MYVWWPEPDDASEKLDLKGIIFIQIELDFITREELNTYKTGMQILFHHLKDEKKIPEIDRVLANKVTFLVYKKVDGFNNYTCNDDIAHGAQSNKI